MLRPDAAPAMKDPRGAVRIVEVGPRDGLQNIKDHVPTSVKIELIQRLRGTGLRTIELTSVVSPRAVPQLSDCRDVLRTEDIKSLREEPNIRLPVLVPNMKGLDIALEYDVKEVAVFISATEGFSKANINCTVQEGLERARNIAEKATSRGLTVRGYVSCIFSDPFDGPTAPSAVLRCVRELLEMGCYEVSLGDTLGVGCPDKVRSLLTYLEEHDVSLELLAGHFHDTYGQAVANTWEAYNCGLRVFDSSISGLGGCPYAPGAKGNVATEDLVYMFHNAGIDTGLDMLKLVETGLWISTRLSRENASRAGIALANTHGLVSPPRHTEHAPTKTATSWSPMNTKGRLLTYRSGGNFKIVLNRPKRGNTLTQKMVADLIAIIANCNKDPSLLNIIITATGGYFCMGVEIGKSMPFIAQGASRNPQAKHLAALLELMKRSPKTTVACLNGHAFGGGVDLALACDVRISLRAATLTFTEATFEQTRNANSRWKSAFIRNAVFSTHSTTAEKLNSLGLVSEIVEDQGQLRAGLDDLLTRLNNSRPAKPRASREFSWSTRAGWDAQADTLDTTFFKMMKLDVGQGDMKASYSGRREDLKRHPSPFTLEFDSLVQRQLEKWKVPGITISVVHGSSTFAKAYGIAEFPDKKMTVDSLFTTCSTTKAFTAAAVSMVIDDTKNTPSPLRWDTSIASLIRDDFVLADDHATMNTTLEDALSHRSGLPGHVFAMIGAYPDETLREAVRKLRHLPLAYPPRTTFDYCNHMFMVVSHVLEQITGESLGELLRKRIWSPLDMNDTYFSVQDVKRCPVTSPKLVQGYTWVPEKGCYVAEPHMNYAPTTGTGAMVSNVLDYAKWLRAMIYKKAPISPEGHTSLIHPRTVISKDDKDTAYPPAPYHLYALGWFVDTYRGQQLYWHSGSWAGFGIMVGFIAEKQFGFAIMGNTQRARNAQLELYLYLIDTLLGVSGSERVEFIERMTKRMADVAEKRSESINETMKRLFPSLPAKPLPHSLPLHAYTGIYHHPGYGIITLRVKDGHLQADLSDRVGAMTIDLEHTAGEFFVARMCTATTCESLRAEFYVDSAGTARKLGMELEPALGGQKIWFGRCG
ncbi:beta-lactamase/transpeptidase-like protein [Aspergillus transmontanensis]|uniref:hydroxymethylglutaryl-CoA lyase n=1 Tax=Aspergillus transmontanensis TaxID=1034304 RepID=A0A5N6W5A5_9EURO|nr:beta-lactamase/transpeptidase-like protein [Aspergillus transmontanensis]